MIHNNQAKIGAEIKTIQEGQEEMKAQVGSVASRIDANQEENRHQPKGDHSRNEGTVKRDDGLLRSDGDLSGE
jgi:hypothetical protein